MQWILTTAPLGPRDLVSVVGTPRHVSPTTLTKDYY